MHNMGLISNSADVIEASHFQNVNVIRATTQQNIVELFEGKRIDVAVVDSCEGSLIDLTKTIAENSDCLFIALIGDRALTEDEEQVLANKYYDFHTKPLDTERFRITLGHAFGMHSLRRAMLDAPEHIFPKLIGRSRPMQKLRALLTKVARSNENVLVVGESGTGKELVSQAIHEASGRSAKPMIEVNCGAIPTELIQSELFGHEKGAFTGAASRRVGLIEAANGGTLFLDEIGDLPLQAQVNLLRVLQEGTLNRIGGINKISVDVRILAATHKDLESLVACGQFRQDLYFRLNVLRLDTPPLRARGADILLLANYFLQKNQCDSLKKSEFSSCANKAMLEHSWPGNVRELSNKIKRAVVLFAGEQITAKCLGLASDKSEINNVDDNGLRSCRETSEKAMIISALAQSNQNVTKAAERLNVSRRTIYRLLDKHSLR